MNDMKEFVYLFLASQAMTRFKDFLRVHQAWLKKRYF